VSFQNAGVTLTLSGAAVSGVGISADSVMLDGSLVVDLSGIDVYDGMQLTLVNATQLTGEWESVEAQSSSECIQYEGLLCVFTVFTHSAVQVTYTQQTAIGEVNTVSLCSGCVIAASLLAL
jgi:hypothetical protein